MAIPRTTAVLAALSSAVLAVGCDTVQDPPDVATAGTHPTGPTTSLDQARTEVGERVEEVRQSAAALGTAVTAVPAGVDPELVAAQQELQTASQRAQQASINSARPPARVTDAQNSAELAAALVTLKPALTATATDVSGY